MQAPQRKQLRRNLSVGAYGAGLLGQPGLPRSASMDPGAARPRVQPGEGGAPAYMQARRRGYRAEKSRERVIPAAVVTQEAAGAMLGAYSAPRQKARVPRPPPGASQPDVNELQARVARKAAALQQLGAQTKKLAAQLGKLTSPAKNIPPPI